MKRGDWFAGRFEIIELLGIGATSSVYRAHDLRTRTEVALKVLGKLGAVEGERFAREATLLSTMRHPHIVEYVAHDTTAAKNSWIALEWLEGQTLKARLEARTLSVDETRVLGVALTRALAALHERGVVHRDIKPGNIWLVGGDPRHCKVLDLGVARMANAQQDLTVEGSVLGTPGYLAPEQARGEKAIDGKADVFALGAVLYVCLSGQKAFDGGDTVGTLLKVMLEEPVPLSQAVAGLGYEIPEPLCRLVHAMLTKAPSLRPSTAQIEHGLLGRLDTATLTLATGPTGLGAAERTMRSIVLCRPSAPDEHGAAIERARRELERIGLGLDCLADGTLFVGTDVAANSSDAAVRAARAASVLGSWLPGATIVIASGRTSPGGQGIDSARAIIERGSALIELGPSEQPRLDEATAGLLEQRFAVVTQPGNAGGGLLGAERERPGGRKIFGNVSPFVGREVDLMFLLAEVDDTISGSVPRAVLVTGPAGIGKSRLYAEWLKGLPRVIRSVAPLVARGDPSSAGAPLALIGQILRADLEIDPDAPRELRRAELTRHAIRLRAPQIEMTAAFWGEIVGTRFSGAEVPELSAARENARLMADHLVSALAVWLSARCAQGPVLLALDDLQWGDWASVRLLDLAVARLGRSSVFVFALARPEVYELMPQLRSLSTWVHRRLAPLDLATSRAIVESHIVAAHWGTDVDVLVDRAAGNPFFLEEFIRVSDGAQGQLPEATLALIEERLFALGADARRVLRAGSILAGGFSASALRWLIGVDATTAADAASADIEGICTKLVEHEIFGRASASPGGLVFAFAHDLYREAAYATLTEEDRKKGHELAAEWLQRGANAAADPHGVARHLDLAGCPERAASWFLRAAQKALDAGDFAAARGFAAHVHATSLEREQVAASHLIAAEAQRWSGAHADAEQSATLALRSFTKGDAAWYAAFGEAVVARGRLGQKEGLYQAIEELASVPEAPPPNSEASRRRTTAVAFLALHLLTSGAIDRASPLFEELARAGQSSSQQEVLARVHQVQAFRGLFCGDLSAYLMESEIAATCFESAGDLREACVQRVNVGNASSQLGAYERARAALNTALRDATRMGLDVVAGYATHNLSLVLARSGDCDGALALANEAVDTFEAAGDKRMTGAARVYAALIMIEDRRFQEAIAEAQAAVLVLDVAPSARACAFGTLAIASARFARAEPPGPSREAALEAGFEAAREARRLVDELGGIEEGEALVHLAPVELHELRGERDSATECARTACERLRKRADNIGDAELRRSFLTEVPEHARTRALATSLGVPYEGSTAREDQQRGTAES